MPYNLDQQYDLSSKEKDKVLRRAELQRLMKQQGIRNRWDPYRSMRHEPVSDPALDRYSDLRKKGRCPNTPMPATRFFAYISMIVVPISLLTILVNYERKDWIAGCESGEIGYEKRKFWM